MSEAIQEASDVHPMENSIQKQLYKQALQLLLYAIFRRSELLEKL